MPAHNDVNHRPVAWIADYNNMIQVCLRQSGLQHHTFDHTPNGIAMSSYTITHYILSIHILNMDCRRSISAILTWSLENVKIGARPLNSMGNLRIMTLLRKLLGPLLVSPLLRMKYMSLLCNNLRHCFRHTRRFFRFIGPKL